MEHSNQLIIPRVKSHLTGREYLHPSLFIQTKGEHAGRPLRKPIANCAVMTLRSTEEVDRWYWMCYGLWKAKVFRYYLRGSVVPFITIPDLRKALSIGELEHGGLAFDKKAKQLIELERLEGTYTLMLEKVRLMQMLILQHREDVKA